MKDVVRFLTPEMKAAVLAYDPFAGDKEAPYDRLLRDEIVVARLRHRDCFCCRGPIWEGERCRLMVAVDDNALIRARWCLACCVAQAGHRADDGAAIEKRIVLGNERDARRAWLAKATEAARKVLRPGDRVSREVCGGRGTFTFTHWAGHWACGRTVSDCHAVNILKVNGQRVSFKAGQRPPLPQVPRSRVKVSEIPW